SGELSLPEGLDLAVFRSSSDTSGDQNINGQLSGYYWGGDQELSYSFPTIPFADDFQGGLNAQQVQTAEFWFDQFAAATGLTFTDAGISAEADLRLATSDKYGSFNGYAYYPHPSPLGGDAFFGTDHSAPEMGEWSWYVFGHEIGHSLGLSHGHEDMNGFGVMDATVDSAEFSIMTYRSYVGDETTSGFRDNDADSFAQTPMMYDIAALQFIYGANFEHNAASTTYSFSTETGEMFVDGVGQGVERAGDKIFLTIWDGDGASDHYDLSNYATDLSIDLRPGGWIDLDVGGTAQRAHLGDGNDARGHVFNALQYEGDARSLIENATGGSGNDAVIGNQAANTLSGGAGDDRLFGAAGNDTLYGGEGNDTAIYALGYGDYAFGIDNGYLTVLGEGLDSLWSDIETLLFDGVSFSFDYLYALVDETPEPDPNTVFGSQDGEWLKGGDDDDVLDGLGGNDVVRGYDGNDTLLGGTGDDTLRGEAGNDVMTGGAGSDAFLIRASKWAEGEDLITDFERGTDTIDLASQDITRREPGLAGLTGDGDVIELSDLEASEDWSLGAAEDGDLVITHRTGSIELDGIAFGEDFNEFDELVDILTLDGETIPLGPAPGPAPVPEPQPEPEPEPLPETEPELEPV
ncbi:MAG: M10 family metallopeptidase, partial [Pseudomonadota bacterium]